MNARDAFNGPLGISLVFIALALLVVAMHLPALAGAVTSPVLEEDPRLASLDDAVALHEQTHDQDIDRFNGRSFYFMPLPPKKKAAAPKPIKRPSTPAPKAVDPGPAPPPANYSGPTPNNIVGSQVWFVGGKLRIRTGEEKDGITVLDVNPPWSVKLGYMGGEYEVAIFERGEFGFLRDGTEDEGDTTDMPGLVEAGSEKEGGYVPHEGTGNPPLPGSKSKARPDESPARRTGTPSRGGRGNRGSRRGNTNR